MALLAGRTVMTSAHVQLTLSSVQNIAAIKALVAVEADHGIMGT